jgi:hypothetical protein
MFIDWVADRHVEDGPLGPIVDLEGFWKRSSSETSARKGMEKYDTVTSENFFYIQPFYKGRAAGVAHTPKDMEAERIGYFYPALGFLALGVLKLLWAMTRSKKAACNAEDEAKVDPVVAAQPLMPSPEMPKPLASNDFIGAISARNASAMAAQTTPIAPHSGLAAMFGGSLGGGLKKAAFGFAALVLYLIIANFGSLSSEPKMIMLTEGVSAQAALEKPVISDVATTAPLDVDPVEITRAEAPDLQVSAAGWLQMVQGKAQSDIVLGGISAPLWVLAVLLLGIILVIYCLRQLGQKRVRRADIDPFDRLLQRRQAEKAREAQGLLLGSSALRA